MKTTIIISSLLLAGSSVHGRFDCPSPVVCDPSLESEDFISSSHFLTDTDCQESCKIGHPFNPCKFFTWVPNAAPGVANCYQMKACHGMSDPITGAKSGAWSCEDDDLFCGAIGDIPVFDERKTVWTCDHNVHPYGENLKIFQDTTCYSTCPSFQYTNDTVTRSDIVVSSSCRWDSILETAVWAAPIPNNVMDSNGDLVQAADKTPSPSCGCETLMLAGEIAEEDGKSFKCLVEPEYDGTNTIIEDSNECSLVCDGLLVFDLFCSEGMWSIDYLQAASDIYCHGSTSEGPSKVTLSTYWPTAPPKTTTTTAGPTTTTSVPTTTTTPAPTTTTTVAPTSTVTTTEGPETTTAEETTTDENSTDMDWELI